MCFLSSFVFIWKELYISYWALALSLHILEDLERRLDGLETTLNNYAKEFFSDDKRESRLAEGLFHSPTKSKQDKLN